MTAKTTELVIDFTALIGTILRHWIWLCAALAIGVAAGFGAAMVLEPKYAAKAVFVPEKAGGMNSSLQALGALTGKLGISGQGSEPPFISHFENFLKTRNFMSELRKEVLEDTILKGMMTDYFGKEILASDSLFHQTASGLIKPEKKDELYSIEAITANPKLSYLVAGSAFNAFDKKLKSTRMKSMVANLNFIEKLSVENRRELEIKSDELRRFLENNRDASSPKLEQSRQGLMLNLKLSEEKYVLTMQEYESAKIQKEKQEESLVLIEMPYLEEKPVSPKPVKCMAIGGFLGAFISFLILAVLTRKDWITGRSGAF